MINRSNSPFRIALIFILFLAIIIFFQNIINQYCALRKIESPKFSSYLRENLNEKLQEFLKLKDEYIENYKKDRELRKNLIESIISSNPSSPPSNSDIIQRINSEVKIQENKFEKETKSNKIIKSDDNKFSSPINSSFNRNLILNQRNDSHFENKNFEDNKEELLNILNHKQAKTGDSKKEKNSSELLEIQRQKYVHDIDPKSSEPLLSHPPISLDFLSESEEEKDIKEITEVKEEKKNADQIIYNPFTVKNIFANFSPIKFDSQSESDLHSVVQEEIKGDTLKYESRDLFLNRKIITKQEIDKLSYSKMFKKDNNSDEDDEGYDQEKWNKVFHN